MSKSSVRNRSLSILMMINVNHKKDRVMFISPALWEFEQIHINEFSLQAELSLLRIHFFHLNHLNRNLQNPLHNPQYLFMHVVKFEYQTLWWVLRKQIMNRHGLTIEWFIFWPVGQIYEVVVTIHNNTQYTIIMKEVQTRHKGAGRIEQQTLGKSEKITLEIGHWVW